MPQLKNKQYSQFDKVSGKSKTPVKQIPLAEDENQTCMQKVQRKFQSCTDVLANYFQCVRVFSVEKLEQLRRKAAEQERELQELHKDTKSQASLEMTQKYSEIEKHPDYKTFTRKEKTLLIEDLDELPVQDYSTNKRLRFTKRYAETYDKSYSERRKRFGYTFQQVELDREKQYNRKQKNFWSEFKRLICCRGGNYIQELEERENATQAGLDENSSIHSIRQSSKKEPSLSSSKHRQENNIFLFDEQNQMKDGPQQVFISKHGAKVHKNVKVVGREDEFNQSSSRKTENLEQRNQSQSQARKISTILGVDTQLLIKRKQYEQKANNEYNYKESPKEGQNDNKNQQNIHNIYTEQNGLKKQFKNGNNTNTATTSQRTWSNGQNTHTNTHTDTHTNTHTNNYNSSSNNGQLNSGRDGGSYGNNNGKDGYNNGENYQNANINVGRKQNSWHRDDSDFDHIDMGVNGEGQQGRVQGQGQGQGQGYEQEYNEQTANNNTNNKNTNNYGNNDNYNTVYDGLEDENKKRRYQDGVAKVKVDKKAKISKMIKQVQNQNDEQFNTSQVIFHSDDIKNKNQNQQDNYNPDYNYNLDTNPTNTNQHSSNNTNTNNSPNTNNTHTNAHNQSMVDQPQHQTMDMSHISEDSGNYQRVKKSKNKKAKNKVQVSTLGQDEQDQPITYNEQEEYGYQEGKGKREQGMGNEDGDEEYRDRDRDRHRQSENLQREKKSNSNRLIIKQNMQEDQNYTIDQIPSSHTTSSKLPDTSAFKKKRKAKKNFIFDAPAQEQNNDETIVIQELNQANKGQGYEQGDGHGQNNGSVFSSAISHGADRELEDLKAIPQQQMMKKKKNKRSNLIVDQGDNQEAIDLEDL